MLEISIVDDVVNVLSDTRVYFQKEEGKNSKNFNGGCDEAKAFAGE